MKNGKIILFVIFVLVGALFSYIFYTINFDVKGHKEAFIKDRKSINTHSKIIDIYRDSNNHNALTLKLSDTLTTVPPDWENRFMIGDSISKNKGSLLMKHYRNGAIIETLDYSLIAKNMR